MKKHTCEICGKREGSLDLEFDDGGWRHFELIECVRYLKSEVNSLKIDVARLTNMNYR